MNIRFGRACLYVCNNISKLFGPQKCPRNGDPEKLDTPYGWGMDGIKKSIAHAVPHMPENFLGFQKSSVKSTLRGKGWEVFVWSYFISWGH